MALEGLDTIAWSELETAQGDPAELPAHLRALRSADPEERKQARSRLLETRERPEARVYG